MPPDGSGSAPVVGGWQRVDLTQDTARAALEAEVEQLQARADPARLFHDLAWLTDSEGRDARAVDVRVARTGDSLIGYAPFVVQPWALRVRVGEITLGSLRRERLHLNAGPLFAEGSTDEAARIAALLVDLRATLHPQQAVFIEGAAADGAVAAAVARDDVRERYLVVEPGPRYERQWADLPATFDAYLAGMKSQTRQNLRNSRRKLERHLEGKLALRRYEREDEVGDFVARAVEVSRRTYQWRVLGLGLRDGGTLTRTLAAMARRGYTRCYLLECAGAATAFMIGYLYRGTYHYVDVGFDPEWEKWSVGTVLHMDVMRDLIEGTPRAQRFDFSSGTGVHKRRFGTRGVPEASFLLLPRTLANRSAIAAMRAADRLSTGAGALLERAGLKAAVKRLIRRRGVTDEA